MTKMSFKKAAVLILSKSRKPMRAEKIIEIAIHERFVVTSAADPAHVMKATLSADIKKRNIASKFYQPRPAFFDLRARSPGKKPVVYIMTNIAMPGYIKVGITTRSGLEYRIKTMDNTSAPLPFELFYAAEVTNAKFIEDSIGKVFINKRVRKNREFYKTAPEIIQEVLELAAVEEIQLNREEESLTKDDRQALEKERNKKK